jgi:catechol 2,3-dioxygenase-like lactoylglutathione lyase family enzyme
MKIIELTLDTGDLNATEHFYTTVLGMPLLTKTGNSISYKAGHSLLTFRKSDFKTPFYHFAFNIPHNQIAEAKAWAEKRVPLLTDEGAEIVDFEDWNAKAIYFYDNNGNIVEFIARMDLDNASAAPFDASAILSVSEAGIVTDFPLQYQAELTARYHLPPFAKGPQRENFSTLGDDHGLILLCQTARIWFPTELPAVQFPLELRFEEGDAEHVLIIW